jgi:hypothetical protein
VSLAAYAGVLSRSVGDNDYVVSAEDRYFFSLSAFQTGKIDMILSA